MSEKINYVGQRKSVLLPEPLHNRLRTLAYERDTSLVDCIRQLLSEAEGSEA